MTRTAFAAGPGGTLAKTLIDQLGDTRTNAALVVFFAHVDFDGQLIGDGLRAHFSGVPVIGCSANGAFSEHGFGKSGCSAIVITRDVAPRVAVAMAHLDPDAHAGIARAGVELSRAFGASLRELDAERHVGLMLVEGATQREEVVNEALGNVAPALRFVGGSAGDDIQFKRTWAYCNGELGYDACSLAVLEMAVPFGIVQACNMVSSGRVVEVTRVEPGTRIIREIDGRPAVQLFAELAGKPSAELGFVDFLTHPLGLMIDGAPWLRSGVRVDGEGVLFACSVLEGAKLDVMRGVELVANTQEQRLAIEQQLGGPIGGAVLFNCAYRMLEAQIKGSEAAYHAVLSTFPHAGIHTNGESYLGHINQTLTGLAFRAS